jgi:hypothetical protein
MEKDKCSNNIVKYEVVLLGLHKLRSHGSSELHIENRLQGDSRLDRKGMHSKRCYSRKTLSIVRRMENYFRGFTVEYIERTKNTEADELAKAATKKITLPPDVFFQTIVDPSVTTAEPEPRMVKIIQGEDWRAPIMAYLCHHYKPDNNTELLRMQ